MTRLSRWVLWFTLLAGTGWLWLARNDILRRLDASSICDPAWRLDTTARLERIEAGLGPGR